MGRMQSLVLAAAISVAVLRSSDAIDQQGSRCAGGRWGACCASARGRVVSTEWQHRRH